ncbi:MAG: hypothetical protein JOZ85_10565 [Betaproteobacteria bacterium]|nr:hypothetical protein [Betaproteobacteria bacterium]
MKRFHVDVTTSRSSGAEPEEVGARLPAADVALAALKCDVRDSLPSNRQDQHWDAMEKLAIGTCCG